jgi:curved DNA-binding protein CbpA
MADLDHIEEKKENQVDFYQLLGVSQEASLKEIKAKFYKLSLLYHPDKETGDPVKYLQIKKAYKILSDPKKRKDYNSSLATTFNEFKQQERDLDYHVNDDFLKKDEEGNKIFDNDKFMATFEKEREKNEELIKLEEKRTKTFEELMAERDNDLNMFCNNQKTELFDPSKNIEGFNQVFMEYQKQRGYQATAVQEVNDPNDPNAGPFAGVDFGGNEMNNFGGFSSSLNDMMSGMSFDQVVTSERGMSQDEINAKLQSYQEISKELEVDKKDQEAQEEFFKKDITCGKYLNLNEVPVCALEDEDLKMDDKEVEKVLDELVSNDTKTKTEVKK